jgi:hypothetical protein
LKAQASQFGAAAAKLFEQLCEVGEKRIAETDAAGIDVQVLSLTSPGTEQLEGDDAMALAARARRRPNSVLCPVSQRCIRRDASDKALALHDQVENADV